MEKFWLGMAILIALLVSYKCVTDGFSRWAFYYIFALMALFTWGLRRYMRRRMEKHQAFLDEQAKGK